MLHGWILRPRQVGVDKQQRCVTWYLISKLTVEASIESKAFPHMHHGRDRGNACLQGLEFQVRDATLCVCVCVCVCVWAA